MHMFRTVMNFHNPLRSGVKGPVKAKLYNKKQSTIIADNVCNPFTIKKTFTMQSRLHKALIFLMQEQILELFFLSAVFVTSTIKIRQYL